MVSSLIGLRYKSSFQGNCAMVPAFWSSIGSKNENCTFFKMPPLLSLLLDFNHIVLDFSEKQSSRYRGDSPFDVGFEPSSLGELPIRWC